MRQKGSDRRHLVLRRKKEEEEILTGGLGALQRLTALLADHGVNIDEVFGQRGQAFKHYSVHRPIDQQLKTIKD